jgi:multiple sugar transport system substrate-binding protein/putative spermidine/putrescine transport system substrate-binding protein
VNRCVNRYALIGLAALAVGAAVAGLQSISANTHSITAAAADRFDARALNRKDFYRIVVPRARAEGSVDLYSFAPSFPPLWTQVLIPRFEAKYGIKVNFFNTRALLADQQLMALRALGRAPSADVYFAPGGHVRLYRLRALAADFDLASLLPEAAAYPAARLLALTWRDRRFVPFHLNQTALAYDRARWPAASVPRDFDALLAWAQAHPRQFAFTAPRSGGSGQGLMLAVAYRFMSAPCRQSFVDAWWDDADAQRWVETSGCLAQTWRYLRALASVSVFTNGNADTQNLLANKAVRIGTVWEDGAYTFLKEKLLEPSFALTAPQPGMPGSADVLFVVAGARHPAAALLLIDFALSRSIQQWKLDEMASRTARDDIDVNASGASAAARFMLPASSLNSRWVWPPAAMVEALNREFDAQVAAPRSTP